MKTQRTKDPVDNTFGLDMLTAYRGADDRIRHLLGYIRECEDITSDCEHFLELYDLNASEQIRVVGVMREALRNRRNAIDEKQLIISALGEIRGEGVPTGGLDFDSHVNRISGTREYKPRAVTLEQCLKLRVKANDTSNR